MLSIGIIGASGYTGAELLRYLSVHGEVQVTYVTSRAHAGRRLGDVFPHLGGAYDLKFQVLEKDEAAEVDLLYICLPHGRSQEITPDLMRAGESKGLKIIDLTGDFRLEDGAEYEEWYGMRHGATQLLGEAVYGLPELKRETIRHSEFVANPGCYPTSALLALAPGLAAGLVKTNGLVIDSKSGVSGAGKSPSEATGFCRVDESLKAYGIGTHKHIPEIEQELSAVLAEKGDSEEFKVSFSAHLVPMARGILSTCYADLAKKTTSAEAVSAYRDYYADSSFVTVLEEGRQPETKEVLGSNRCLLGLVADERLGRLVVTSAIDNLGKGASGQAVQNMNLMCGFEETAGLAIPAVWP